jgi:RecA-family ATPase
MFGVALSMAMCSGRDFLGWTIPNPVPTLYVESELPGDQFRSRRNAIKTDYFEKGIPFRAEHHFTLTQDDLTMAGFKYGFKSIAVAQHEGKDAAKDYGRKGREFIENILYKIEQRTGRKPFYFLDNMTRLATIDENKAPDWHPFINWGIDIKNKGFAGCFVHHANKGGNSKGSSGSSTIGRLLDTSIALRKLDNEYRFDMTGKANMQSSIEFDKSRGFGGSDASKKRIITMNEYGEWKAYPYLKQVSFQILKFHNQGMSQKEIREIHKELDLSAPSVDRLYKELVELKLIQKERKSHCWKCKKEISHTQHERCQKCTSGIICNHIDDKTGKECGACYCENPKRKKNENKTPY